MKLALGEKGFIKTLLMLLFLGALFSSLVLFGKPYYRSFTLAGHTRDFLKTEAGNIDAIRANIMKNAEELGINLKKTDLSVTISSTNMVKVKATWQDTVDLWGYYQKTFDFEMNEEH